MEMLLSALKAAGEATRLRLLALCAHSDLTVSDLTSILGQSQPRVSRHLKLLCDGGLLDRSREGSWVYFRLTTHGTGAEIARTLVDSIPSDDGTLTRDLERLERIRQARSQRASDYFRRNAKQWDQIRSLYVEEHEVEKKLLELLPGELIGDLLDIGTGTGRVIELLAPRVTKAVGVDLSSEMLMVARANIERASLRNCTVKQGDMYQLPVQSGSFDAVTLHQVLHFAETPSEVLAEAARTLRPGGRLIVVDFQAHDLDYLRDEHSHRWLGFRDADVQNWFKEAGLIPSQYVELPGDPLTVGIWTAERPPADHTAINHTSAERSTGDQVH
jgi:ArsR family transcriptional regulator